MVVTFNSSLLSAPQQYNAAVDKYWGWASAHTEQEKIKGVSLLCNNVMAIMKKENWEKPLTYNLI